MRREFLCAGGKFVEQILFQIALRSFKNQGAERVMHPVFGEEQLPVHIRFDIVERLFLLCLVVPAQLFKLRYLDRDPRIGLV